MRRATVAIIAAPFLLLALGWLIVAWFVAQDRDYVRSEQIFSRQLDAKQLTLVTLESERARQGRYPDKLSTALFPEPAFRWFYRATQDGLDYELWCALEADENGVQAMIFSPDGQIAPDWPGDRSDLANAWTLVKNAQRAPKERWTSPFIPDVVGSSPP
ncbi:MAG: hypothetical protein HEQ23_14860 [Tepidisphaera sp.]